MAADDITSTGLPPIGWTGNTGSDANTREPERKDRKVNRLRDSKLPKTSSSELEYEQPEHELDSIA